MQKSVKLTKNDPFVISYRRIDIVTKVPNWAKESHMSSDFSDLIHVGDEVLRRDTQSVYVIKSKDPKCERCIISLGMSYSKYDRHEITR